MVKGEDGEGRNKEDNGHDEDHREAEYDCAEEENIEEGPHNEEDAAEGGSTCGGGDALIFFAFHFLTEDSSPLSSPSSLVSASERLSFL